MMIEMKNDIKIITIEEVLIIKIFKIVTLIV